MNGERVTSGRARLDEVLGGGLLEHSITLVGGAPGTGKSVLAQQYVFANATAARPALVVTTVSEPLDKTVRYAQTLRFFDPDAIGSRVYYHDAGPVIRSEGLGGLLRWLIALVQQRQPALFVLDSLRALDAYSTPDEFRTFLYDLAAVLGATATTTLWLGEYASKAQLTAAPEAAVADAVVHLRTDDLNQRELRLFQVIKLRGSSHLSGQHAYRLDREGLHVFPRLAASQGSQRPGGRPARAATGLAALDDMLDGGYPRGSSTLVAGPTGAGKTLLGLHFLAHGVAQGEPGVIATLQDPPGQLSNRLTDIDPDLPAGAVEILYRSPVDVYIDEWIYEVLELIDRQQARRVLIDGLVDLDMASADPLRFREYLSSLVDRFAIAGVTAIMTHELPLLFRVDQLHTDAGYSNLSDSVIVVQYLMGSIRLQRAVTVLKTQGAANDLTIRRFAITTTGMDIGDPLAPRGEVSAP